MLNDACFNWCKSDIDFIVVVKNALSQQTKLELLEVLEENRKNAPQKGFEMSVVLEKYCRNFAYPTPYELHFSNGWLERYLNNPLLLCGDEIKTDYDLAAHFTVIHKVGIAFCGPPIADVFGDVPDEYYTYSIKRDIINAKEDVADNPVYIVLNLCRVLAFLNGSIVLSKEQGGLWGIENLPVEYHGLIMAALDEYNSKAAHDFDIDTATDFCGYMLAKIFDGPM